MTDYSRRYRHLETNLVHAGAPHPAVEDAVITPIFQSANYAARAEEMSYGGVRYMRLHNSPNHHSLHARLAAVEGTEAALVLGSGMAAISGILLATLESGSHFLAHKSLYGGTQTLIDQVFPGIEISATAIDAARPDDEAWEAALCPETRMIYVEAFSNPTLDVADFEAVVRFARRHDLLTVIDNTFATPFNLRPAELGFDLVVHSATKYLNGHSDIIAGVVAGRGELVEKILHLQQHLGAVLDAHAAFLLERGLKTLALRVERQNDNALRLAEFLAGHRHVSRVNYPGLSDHHGHAVARRHCRGFGGMMSFATGDVERSLRFLERVRIPIHAASLGAVETLVVRPTQSSHLGMPEDERNALGITDDLIRVSVGIEAIDELIEDFDQALSD